MKRLISVYFALLLALSLTACGSAPSKEDVRGEVTPAATTAPETQPETEAETQATTEPELSLGSSADNTYTSTFLGLQCTLDSAWMFYSDEEILELNQLAQDMLDEELAERLRNADTIQDMYAMNPYTDETLNITLTNTGKLFGSVLTTDTYAEMSVPQLAPALESMGLTNVSVEQGTLTFLGQTCTAIRITAVNSGEPFYETMVILKQSDYIACITASSYAQNTTETVLEQFCALG